MARIDVALASCRRLPEPDPDAQPLQDALRAKGWTVEVAAWDDPSVDWSRYRLTLLRSTWNYFEDRDGFLAWAEGVDRASRLLNPLSVVSWNTHKRYLLELEQRGVPTVPTALVPRGRTQALSSLCRERGWTDVVVKPAVSAASFQTHAMKAAELDQGTFDRLVTERDVLVQPFVQSVLDHGERAVVVIEGEATHSVRKSPRFRGEDEQVSAALPVAEDERALAARALAVVGQPLLYARVDVARDERGAPQVMELELTEPSLFFPQSPEALGRFVRGVERRLQERS